MHVGAQSEAASSLSELQEQELDSWQMQAEDCTQEDSWRAGPAEGYSCSISNNLSPAASSLHSINVSACCFARRCIGCFLVATDEVALFSNSLHVRAGEWELEGA